MRLIHRRVDFCHAWEKQTITKHGKYMHICIHVYMHVCEIQAGLGQACLFLFGGLCRQTLPPLNYMYLELGVWTDASPTLRQSPQQDKMFVLPSHRIRSKGKGYTCRVGISRNFRTCAYALYVRCALSDEIQLSVVMYRHPIHMRNINACV